MAADIANTATIDLGEDLNCAICMQILFQPLTLLDCMHTFCGACLKDWFAHQAANARSLNPYTCPSCRDSVRSTKRYPFIMNMLEKHLNKNPDKVRSEEDKQEHMEKYKPGDNVLLKLRHRGPAPDPEDERVLNEVMQLSLQEAGVTDGSLQPPDAGRRRRGNSRGTRSRTSSRSPGPLIPEPAPAAGGHAGSRTPLSQLIDSNRQVQHQSSLISLLSVSEMDPSDMQEEITRMIAEEGLLDDVDLSNLDSTREEELSERIAAAYRRRKEEARRRRRQENDSDSHRSRQRDRSSTRQSNSRPTSRSGVEDPAARLHERRRPGENRPPPISNPQLMNSANQGQTRHRRSGSSNSNRPSVRTDSGIAASSPTLAPILPPGQQSDERPRRSTERSATDPNRTNTAVRPTPTSNAGSAPSTPRIAEPSLEPPRTHARQRSDSSPQRSPRLGSSSTFPRTAQNRSTSSLPLGPASLSAEPSTISAAPDSSSVTRSTMHEASRNSTRTYTEPSVSCSVCRREHIEYDVHYNCPRCFSASRQFRLCKPCFRRGEGSRHQQGAFPTRTMESGGQTHHGEEKPHVFTAARFAKPRRALRMSPTPDNPQAQLTEDNPADRLERGVFCDLCESFANNCYWKCDACNEGVWGYCNSCVMQGKHCTHPLQPLKAIDSEDGDLNNSTTNQVDGHLTAPVRPEAKQQPSPPSTPKSASIIDGPVVIPVANIPFKPLTFHTVCDICTTPIPPSVTRYHCPKCNGGDYDICMSCYHGLVSTGKISYVNGPQGWRKCPQGHRMVVIGFQDSGGGQRRVVDRDIVGGWTFDESSTQNNPQPVAARKWRWKGDDGSEKAVDPEYRTRAHSHTVRLPPDGGIGLIFYSKWNYFPDDASEKDLCFPKGAEVREAEDINGEWLWGYYAGKTGLFPAAYVDFLRKVGM